MKNKIAILTVVTLMAMPLAAFADSTVVATTDNHSGVSPSGITIVPTGITQTFNIDTDSGYTSNVSVDGSNIGSTGSVDFTGIANDPIVHSINVTSISTDLGGGGTPFCSGPLAPGWHTDMVGGGCGGTQTFTPSGVGDCPAWFPAGCVSQ